MKNVLILFAGLLLITALSFAQQGSVSKMGPDPNTGSPTGNFSRNIDLASGLSVSTTPKLSDWLTDRSSGFGNMGIAGLPNFSSNKRAADETGAFPKGSFAINLGVGLGNLYWGAGYGSGFGVSPTLDLDYAITDKLGIGNIAVGGTVSYSSTKIYGYNFTGILVGLRGTYHFIIPIDNLDPYAGILLGYIITNNPNLSDNNYGLYGKGSGFQPGIYAGAHYFFVPHFGVFAELGYNGFSIFCLGITIKL